MEGDVFKLGWGVSAEGELTGAAASRSILSDGEGEVEAPTILTVFVGETRVGGFGSLVHDDLLDGEDFVGEVALNAGADGSFWPVVSVGFGTVCGSGQRRGVSRRASLSRAVFWQNKEINQLNVLKFS